ncbi:MAG: hypothetical protein PHE78_04830 [Candidatus Gastranaerophilales bacterium]|nr:hypothetical protein [Candidatus Gastranaerophilales bacterium]
MGKKKKLAKIHKSASGKILEIKALLDTLSEIEQSSYPANTLIEIANEKALNVFQNIEHSRQILKITD